MLQRIKNTIVVKSSDIKQSVDSKSKAAISDIVQGVKTSALAEKLDYKATDAMSNVLKKIKAIADNIESRVYDALNKQKSPIIQSTIEISRKLRIVDPIDFSQLPRLKDDEKEDYEIKQSIFNSMFTDLSSKSDLVTQISPALQMAYYDGVSTKRLVEFLNDPVFIDEFVNRIINIDEPIVKTNSLRGGRNGIIDKFAYKLDRRNERKGKEKLTPEIIEELDLLLTEFVDDYDPSKPAQNIVRFIMGIYQIERFSKYAMHEWFADIEVISTIKTQIIKGIKNSIKAGYIDTVNEKINSKGVKDETSNITMDQQVKSVREFTDLHFDTIFYEEDNEFIFDIDELNHFFALIADKIDNGKGKIFYSELRTQILDEIMKHINAKGIDACSIRILCYPHLIDNEDKRMISKTSLEETKGVIEKLINEHTSIPTSDNPKDFLLDPKTIPREIKDTYELFFPYPSQISNKKAVNLYEFDKESYQPPQRAFDQMAYEKHLMNIFGYVNDEHDIEDVEQVVATLFDEADYYFELFARRLNLGSIYKSKIVKNINTWWELEEIAGSDYSSEIERFEARRKLEMAKLIYRAKYARVFVELEDDILKIMSRLTKKYTTKSQLKRFKEELKVETEKIMDNTEKSDRSIDVETEINKLRDRLENKYRINRQPLQIHKNSLREIIFEDDELEGVTLKYFGKQTKHEGKYLGANIRSELLIDADFEGIRCGIKASIDPKNGEMKPIRAKSLTSIQTKIIKKGKKIEKLGDLSGMTFVVETKEELKAMRKNIERVFTSFGAKIKIENMYGDLVDVESKNIEPNASKSARYKALRYVIEVPVEHYTGRTFATIEIRVMLAKDYQREISKYCEENHENYKERRIVPVGMKIIPPELYPEFHHSKPVVNEKGVTKMEDYIGPPIPAQQKEE